MKNFKIYLLIFLSFLILKTNLVYSAENGNEQTFAGHQNNNQNNNQNNQSQSQQTTANSQQGKKEKWKHKVKFEIGAVLNKGNTDSFLGKYSFDYSSELKNRWEIDFSALGIYGEENGVNNKNKHDVKFTVDHIFGNGKFTVFYFGSFETAEFQGIYARTSHGIGFKWKPVKKWWVDFSISLAPIWEYERTWDEVTKKDIFRFSLRPKLVFWFSKNHKNEFKAVFYYMPKIDEFSNYRMNLLLVLKLNISGNFYSSTKFLYEYSSSPIDVGVKKSDYSLITSLGLEF